MALDSGTITPEERSRVLTSPVAFSSQQNTANFVTGRDQAERIQNSAIASTISTASLPRIDSCILGRETLQQREKFTLYKVEVNNGLKSWIIYRRYGDFALLNRKLRKLFPQFRLELPAKRFFKDNFAEGFIERRQNGLEEFTRNLLCHRDLVLSQPVQKFYRLNNPPQPNESLEASQNYCESLERSLADIRLRLRDNNAELTSVKTELNKAKYHRDESQDLANHLQKQQSDVEEATKGLRDQLTISQENERKAKEDLEVLREEIRAERASVQAARLIERQKREVVINRQMDTFNQSQDAVTQRVNGLVTAIGQLPKVQLDIGGKKFEVNAENGVSDQAVELREALNESRRQLENIHRNALENYKQEVEDLKAEFSRADFLAKARTQEAETVKLHMADDQRRFQDGFKEQSEYISTLQMRFSEVQQYANATEEKYFFSLVIGVKLNMALCGYRVHHINHLKPQQLFERVRNHGISIEHWPSWLSRELSTASVSSS